MRDFLTGIAIILIVALTTMLVAPYFVDWNSQRGFLEGQLTRALGQKVTIGGNIDLKLLPTPYLRLNQTVIGGDDGAVKIGIRYLDLELSVAPLLHGEFDIVEGRLEEPTIRLTLQPDRTLPSLPDTPALRANVRLERVSVVDGTLAVADPTSGRTIVLDHLDFTVEAPTLAGPFRGNGAAGDPAARTKFRFSTTEAQAGKTKLRLALDETTAHPGLDLDGDVTLRARERAQGAETVRQSFAGSVVATGHVLDAVDAPIAWRLSGPLEIDPESASFGDGEFRIGATTDDGLSFAASGEGTFGAAPAIRMRLHAKQLDIDRLAGAPANGVRPPPPKLPSRAALRRLVAAATPSLPTTIDIDAESAVWGGEALSGLAAHVALDTAAPHRLTLAGDGPGGLRIDVDGKIPKGGGFDGRLGLAVEDLPLALRWLASVAPDAGVPRHLPMRSASIGGRLVADASGFNVQDLALGLDRSKLTGTAAVTVADQGPAKLVANLATPTLDLDTVPDLHAIEGRTEPIDLALKLDAGEVRIARVGGAPLQAGHVRLDLSAQGKHVAVDAFEAENLGGATVRANGTVDETAAAVVMTVDAARLDQAAALVRQLAPGRATQAFAARAGTLAPANLKIAATFTGTASGLAPSKLDAVGHFATTDINVHLTPEPSGDSVALDAKATTARGGTLLRQLGLPGLPIDLVGASSVTVSAKGAPDHRLDTKVDAAFGKTRVAIDGRFDLFGTGRGGSGTLTVASPDTSPLLQDLAIVPVDLTARMPVDATAGLAIGQDAVAISDIKGRFDDVGVAGTLKWQAPAGEGPALTGALDLDRLALGGLFGLALGPARAVPAGALWSTEPFDAALVDPPRSAVALRVAMLDLGFGLVARTAAFDLGVAPNVVTLKRGGAEFAGGRVGFDVALRRDGRQAALDGSLSADKVALSLPAIKATTTAKLDVAGSGQSVAALVSSLAGSGEAMLAGTAVDGIDVSALPRVFAEVEADTLTIDEESILRAFVDNAKGSLDAGTRRFALGLAGGVMTATPRDKPIVVGPVAATLEGGFDLRRLRSDVRVGETLNELPKDWTGPPPAITVVQAGAPTNPTRSFDVGNFVNAVAARAIARESARIETYEFDIRERALFNARLQSDRRREEDRLKAEADAKAAAEAARQAEADRRAKADAARLDRSRAEGQPEGRTYPAPAPEAPRVSAPPPGSTPLDPSASDRY